MAVRHNRRRRAKRQEGFVLLVAGVLVMMMAGFATFAAHYALTDASSARNWRQAQRLRRANEAVLDSVGAYLEADLPRRTSDPRWTAAALSPLSLRRKFGLADDGGDALNYLSSEGDLKQHFAVPLLPRDQEISGGATTPFTFQSEVVLEVYDLGALPGQTVGGPQKRRERVIATAYTQMLYEDDRVRTGDDRGRNELVGISRAYFDVVR